MSSESHYSTEDFSGSDYPDVPAGKYFNDDPKRSAQPCGCDPGSLDNFGRPYKCERHREFIATHSKSLIDDTRVVVKKLVVANKLPTDPAERKGIPLATGVLDYFPDALIEVARVSMRGNEQHNPGKPLHWDRTKSTDEADTLMRHFTERGTLDADGMRHSAKVAWRALALLQKEIEASKA